MRKQSCAVPAAIQRLTEQLECATAYVDACLRSAGCVSKAHPTVESKKRKRASPFPGTHDRDFAEQLSMPGTPTMDLLPLLRGELRHYQLQGVRWLYSMYTNGLASILADESDEDRKIQVAGLVSCLRSKGMFGPLLLIAPASNHQSWATQLQSVLGNGVLLHCMQDGSPGSQQALHQFCKGATQHLSMYAGDVSCVPPSSIVVTTPCLLIQQQQCLSQQGFKFLVLDTARSPPGDTTTTTGMDTHMETHHPASPCTSTVYSSAAAQDGGAGAVSSAAHHHNHHHHQAAQQQHHQGGQSQAQQEQHTRRQSSYLGAGRTARLPHATVQLPGCGGGAGGQHAAQQHHAHHAGGSGSGGAAGGGGGGGESRDVRGHPSLRQTHRRHSGPVTRSASQPVVHMEEGDDDLGHAQLVWSLSRLSSSGHAVDDPITGQSYTEGVTKGHSDHSLKCPVPRALSSSSLDPPTVHPLQHQHSGTVTACVKPPRPSMSRSKLAANTAQLASVCSWPPNLANTGPVAAAAGAGSAAANVLTGPLASGCGPGAGAGGGPAAVGPVVQVPPWLTAHQQPVVWGPITRKRSSIVAQHGLQAAVGAVSCSQQAGGGGGEVGGGVAGAGQEEEEEGVNLSGELVAAMRRVVPGQGGVLLLADVPVGEQCQLDALWPLLTLLLNSAVHPLHESVQQAIQVGDLQLCGEDTLHVHLRGLVSRFVLRRATTTTSLDHIRRQGPECNLYDLFACAD